MSDKKPSLTTAFAIKIPSKGGLATYLYPDSEPSTVRWRALDLRRDDLNFYDQAMLWDLMHYAVGQYDRIKRTGERYGELVDAWSDLWSLLLRHLDPDCPLDDIPRPPCGRHPDYRRMSRTRQNQMELFT